jgi:hypothetical protein
MRLGLARDIPWRSKRSGLEYWSRFFFRYLYDTPAVLLKKFKLNFVFLFRWFLTFPLSAADLSGQICFHRTTGFPSFGTVEATQGVDFNTLTSVSN